MTYMYKSLPDGGYTAVPTRTDVERARLMRQGWSASVPVQPVAPTEPETEPGPVVDEAPPKRRGRPRRESVN